MFYSALCVNIVNVVSNSTIGMACLISRVITTENVRLSSLVTTYGAMHDMADYNTVALLNCWVALDCYYLQRDAWHG